MSEKWSSYKTKLKMPNRKLQLNKGDLMIESSDFKFELVFLMEAGTLDFTAIFPKLFFIHIFPNLLVLSPIRCY